MQEEATAYLATVRAAALRMLHGKEWESAIRSGYAEVDELLRTFVSWPSPAAAEYSMRMPYCASGVHCRWYADGRK